MMHELITVLGMVAMAPPGGEGSQGMLSNPIFLFIIILLLFYFILYMPEKKRKQQREQMLKNLDRGDEVITAGGIYGTITALTDNKVTIEIAPNVRIKVARQHVSLAQTKEPSESKSKDSDKNNGDKKSKKGK